MIKTSSAPAMIEVAEHALETGAHELALKKLRPIWDFENPEQDPNVDGCSETEIPALLLYCGIHYGFYGLNAKGMKEKAKDLLTAAYDIFKDLWRSYTLNPRDMRRTISLQTNCANYLALSYWQMGDTGNAEIYLKAATSLHESLELHDTARLYTFIVESLINCVNGNHEEIIENLQKHSKDFIFCGNAYTSGMYYANLGNAKKNVGDLDGAIENHLLARKTFQKLGHRRFLSYVENHIANVYRAKKEPEKAKEYVERSLTIAKKIGDIRQIGCAYDTLALLAYDAGDYSGALKYSNKSIVELEKTECYGYLVEYYETKIKILLKINSKKAFTTYHKAMAIAERYCESLCEQLTDTISERGEQLPAQKPQALAANTWLLRFQKGFEPVGKVTLIKIPSNDLIPFQLTENSFAVVEGIGVRNGDLVGIEERETGDCFLGLLDSNYGFIGLEVDGDLEIFNESEVEILGKVVGYCPELPDADGYYKVVSFE